MVLAAVRQTGQKSNSRRYPQHQERSIFDLIGQFSECVAAEALRSVCDRLAYASRALFYAAHDAIQGVIHELTDVIGGAGAFALRRTRQAAKPLLKVAYKLLNCSHFFRSHGFCTRGHIAPESVQFSVWSQTENVARLKMFQANEGLTARGTLCIRAKTSCNSSLPAALNSFVAR
jgi:hypothetical protein